MHLRDWLRRPAQWNSPKSNGSGEMEVQSMTDQVLLCQWLIESGGPRTVEWQTHIIISETNNPSSTLARTCRKHILLSKRRRHFFHLESQQKRNITISTWPFVVVMPFCVVDSVDASVQTWLCLLESPRGVVSWVEKKWVNCRCLFHQQRAMPQR